ncbi:MAG TPA: hypothetical protein VGL46_13215 [Pseudonocardiaceae bacterium]
MSVTTLVATGLSVAMVLAAIWLYLVYTWGNAWYASVVGRALVTLAGSVVFIQLFSLARRLLAWPAWTSDIEQGLILLALVILCLAFHHERRVIRRTVTAQKDHRIERESP